LILAPLKLFDQRHFAAVGAPVAALVKARTVRASTSDGPRFHKRGYGTVFMASMA